MRHVLRWCTLAGIMSGLLGLAIPASAATGWTVVTPSGLPPGTQNYLNGSFALSDTDAWAVGESENASTGAEAPLVLNWNGTAWSSVSTPAPSGSTPNWLNERLGVRRLLRPALERDRVVRRLRCTACPPGERGRPQRHLGHLPQ